MIDLAALTNTVYNRLKTDEAGADVRAALTDGAGGVALPLVLGTAKRPKPPFVILREGPAPNYERISYAPFFSWYIYDLPAQGYYRINQIAGLIGGAYEEELVSPFGATITEQQIETLAGQGTLDVALNLNMRLCTLALTVL